jgi:hypothetical protein
VDVNEIIICPTRQEVWSRAIAWESIDSLLNTAQRLNRNKGWWIEPYPAQHRQATAADSVIKQILKDVAVKLYLNKVSLYLNTRDMERIYLKKPDSGSALKKLSAQNRWDYIKCLSALVPILFC